MKYNMNALRILLIEDDEIEVLKFNRALKKLGHKHDVISAKNGEEALQIINDNAPELIFLDLNMPKMSGLEFLKILKNDDKMRFIPTMILSTSRNLKDVLESYRLGIAGYITKPLHFEDYVTKIEHILNYWLANELIRL